MTRARHPPLVRAVVLAGVLCAAPAAADRLHLAAGGTIDVDHWRLDGDQLIYSDRDGSVGIPRSIVIRIEPTESDGPDTTTDGPAPEPATPAAPAGGSGPTATIRVTREVAETMRAARAALDARDYRSAADLYGDALRDGPDTLQPARVGYALAQLSLGEDAFALGAVLDGLAREPLHPELLELLGDLRDRQERVEDAIGAWRQARAARDAPPPERLERKIERARRELAAGRDYAMSASSHFTLRHDGEIDRALTRAVLDHLESEFWRISRDLDHTPRQPITVLLYPDREFRDVTGAESWVGGLYDGKIRVPLGGLRRLEAPARRVLTHELAHAVLHAKTRGNAPRWLHEGLAQRAEGHRPTALERRSVAALFDNTTPEAWDAGGVSYPGALSLTRFIIDHWGENAMLRLLGRLGDGLELNAALRETYGESYTTLCRLWARAVTEGDRR